MAEKMKLVTIGGLLPVDYTSRRVHVSTTKLQQITLDSEREPAGLYRLDDVIYRSLMVKSANWSQEREWRLVLDERICSCFGNRIPFPYISRIYLGCRMDVETKHLMAEIGDELGVEVIPMEMDAEQFRLEQGTPSFYEWEKERQLWTNPFTQ